MPVGSLLMCLLLQSTHRQQTILSTVHIECMCGDRGTIARMSLTQVQLPLAQLQLGLEQESQPAIVTVGWLVGGGGWWC